jgi:hypothetical protein
MRYSQKSTGLCAIASRSSSSFSFSTSRLRLLRACIINMYQHAGLRIASHRAHPSLLRSFHTHADRMHFVGVPIHAQVWASTRLHEHACTKCACRHRHAAHWQTQQRIASSQANEAEMRDAKTARRKRPEVMRSAAQHVGIEDVEQVWRMQRQEQVPVYVVILQGRQVLVVPRRDAFLLQPVRDLPRRRSKAQPATQSAGRQPARALALPAAV